MAEKTSNRGSTLFWQVAVPTVLFLVAFLPRVLYPVSRPMQWYYRAIGFYDALTSGAWSETFQSYHPGVTTMWLAGGGLKLFSWLEGFNSDQLLGIIATPPGTVNEAITWAMVPLALVLAAIIVIDYAVLSRLTTPLVALICCALMALDPFHITYSKVLHLNALLASLMFTSALFLFGYGLLRRRRYLVLSALFAGLSLLTKSPALFLLPYAALALAVYQLARQASEPTGLGVWRLPRTWLVFALTLGRELMIWTMGAILTYAVLWPAMWTAPAETLSKTLGGILFHVNTSHENPVFFNGVITMGDPGPLFYVATIAWKSTLLTLPLVVVALITAIWRRGRWQYSLLTGLLAAYVFFFTVQMNLGEWKQTPYMVPVFPALSVLAGLGLAVIISLVRRVIPGPTGRRAALALVALIFIFQMVIVLSRHPYYGTHHNKLLGGSATALQILPLQEQGEGLDLAAQYLNALPRAQQARTAVFSLGAEFFERSFEGFTNTVHDPWNHYRIYYVNQVTRQLGGPEWKEAWKVDQLEEPLWTVSFDSVPYVWIYGQYPPEPAAAGPQFEIDARLGESIVLDNARLSTTTLAPGDSLTVVLNWRVDGPVSQDLTVFTHLLAADRTLAAQRDGVPVYGVRPTLGWRPGEAIEDSYEIFIPEEIAAGEYELSAGMYDTQNLVRVPAFDSTGRRLSEDRVVIGVITIESP